MNEGTCLDVSQLVQHCAFVLGGECAHVPVLQRTHTVLVGDCIGCLWTSQLGSAHTPGMTSYDELGDSVRVVKCRHGSETDRQDLTMPPQVLLKLHKYTNANQEGRGEGGKEGNGGEGGREGKEGGGREGGGKEERRERGKEGGRKERRKEGKKEGRMLS